MSFLSIRPRAFRTRNPGRDAETDEARFSTISNAIAMALADARREREGLGLRVNFYHAQASSLLDNSGEYGKRDQADENAIGSAEQNAKRARLRMVTLDEQILRLEALLDQVDRNIAPMAVTNEGVA